LSLFAALFGVFHRRRRRSSSASRKRKAATAGCRSTLASHGDAQRNNDLQ
jgi:hypothetical protein